MYNYDVGRPATGKTPHRTIRVPDEEWEELKERSAGDATSLIRQFIRWYLRRPGAKLPVRPDPKEERR
jgi:hypothetical protein